MIPYIKCIEAIATLKDLLIVKGFTHRDAVEILDTIIQRDGLEPDPYRKFRTHHSAEYGLRNNIRDINYLAQKKLCTKE